MVHCFNLANLRFNFMQQIFIIFFNYFRRPVLLGERFFFFLMWAGISS